MGKATNITKNFFKQLKEDNLNTYASSCAFYFFLSLVPILVIILAVLPYTPIDPSIVIDWVREELPAGIGDLLVSIINEVFDRSIGLLSIAIITTMWSAGKGVNSLIVGFNAIDKYQDKRNGILVRIVASFYTLIFLVGLIVILLVVVLGNTIVSFLMNHFPAIVGVVEFFLSFRALISFGIMTIVFMLAYALLPYKKHKIKEQIPGALFTSVCWTGFSFLFSFYLSKFTDAFSMYGSLATIVVFLMWLYFCMYFLFLGDNLNRYFRPVIKAVFKKNRNMSEIKGQFHNLEENI